MGYIHYILLPALKHTRLKTKAPKTTPSSAQHQSLERVVVDCRYLSSSSSSSSSSSATARARIALMCSLHHGHQLGRQALRRLRRDAEEPGEELSNLGLQLGRTERRLAWLLGSGPLS